MYTESEELIYAIGLVIEKLNPKIIEDHESIKKRQIASIVCRLGADLTMGSDDKYGFANIKFDVLFSEFKRLKKLKQ